MSTSPMRMRRQMTRREKQAEKDSSGNRGATPMSGADGVPSLDLKGMSPGGNQPGLGNHALHTSARSGRSTTAREIQQPSGTVFEINPEDWNNVPKIIYDAVIVLVNEADAAKKRA